MKQYTKKQLRGLRRQPAPEFLLRMATVLANLPDPPDAHTAIESEAGIYVNVKAKALQSRYKVILTVAAALLLVFGLHAMNNRSVLPSTELTIKRKDAEPVQIAEIKNYNQNPLPLDRIDINVEPDLLWNSASGILAKGDQVTDSDSPPYRNAVYRKMSEQGKSVEGEIVYRPSGQGAAFQQSIRLMLDTDYYSMDMPQKSLRIEAADKPFEYQLFDDRDALTYQSILLRNAGNDSLFTRIADGVQSRLIDRYLDTNMQTLAWKPVSVYLNGKYWGIYNMRESPDAYTICRHENIDPDKAQSATILKLDGTAIQGDGEEYSKLISAVSSGNPGRITEDLAFLEQNIDVDSYLNWLAVKAYFGDLDAASTFICYQIPGQKWK